MDRRLDASDLDAVRHLSRTLVAPLALLLSAACTETPMPSQSTSGEAPGAPAAHFAQLEVGDALARLAKLTMRCLGPAEPTGDPREWLCRHDYEDGSAIEVRVIGDSGGITQLVGIALRREPDEAVSFLAGVVASLAAPDPLGTEIRVWASKNPEAGQRWAAAGVSVDLQPHSEARAVIVDPAPAAP